MSGGLGREKEGGMKESREGGRKGRKERGRGEVIYNTTESLPITFSLGKMIRAILSLRALRAFGRFSVMS